MFGVDADLSQPGARSRYCSAIECPDFKAAGPGLLQLLEDLGRQFAERPVLFPSGDLNLSLVSDERERLARWYRLSLSRREVVRRALDKRAFYEFAMRHALPIPRTFFLDGTHDPEAVADEIEYPCIVKPFRPTAAWRRRFDTRLFICGSREELLAIHSRLVTVHREILVQEYMTGSDCELYDVPRARTAAARAMDGPEAAHVPGALRYGDVRGEPPRTLDRRADGCDLTTPRRPRLWHDRVQARPARRPVQDDRGDDRSHLVPHGLVTASGVNLPYVWYRDAIGLPPLPSPDFIEGLKWINEERDLNTVWRYSLPSRELTLASWLASYRGRRTYAYAAWDDPGPGIRCLGRLGRSAFRLARSRLRGGRAGGRPSVASQQDAGFEVMKLRAESRGMLLR